MKKTALLLAVTLIGAPLPTLAQGTFWSFDDNNRQIMIPPQCDGQFDDTMGGAYIPTPQELFEQGELFLLEKGAGRNNAGYCLLAAALQNHVEAQYRVAQLYNKGVVLAQDDLSAYRWAFIAALNGHKEAEQMVLMLEQFLTTEDIQLATQPINNMRDKMLSQKQSELNTQKQVLQAKKKQLHDLKNEINMLKGKPVTQPVPVAQKNIFDANDGATVAKQGVTDTIKESLFDESDRIEE